MSKFDGICGMAYQSIAANNNVPLIPSLKAAKQIDNATVTFNLTNTDQQSTMTIGSEDPEDRSGDYQWHKVSDEH